MKPLFVTELKCHLKGDKIWVLDEPLIFYSNLLKMTVMVPVEFETDLASVPRIPIIYGLWGARAHREAVLHDALYRIDSIPVVKFSVANKVFLEAMKSRGKPGRVRWPMYLGVVIGGYMSYHKHKMDFKFPETSHNE